MHEHNRDKFSVSRTFINGFFILLGLLLWYSAYEVRPGLAQETHAGKSLALLVSEILKDIGVVVFSLALVDLLWERFGGEPVQAQIRRLVDSTNNALNIIQQAQATGLTQILSRIGNVSDAVLLEYIASAKLQIDLCGYTLYYIFEREQLARVLHERVLAGVPVRILIGDPTNEQLFTNVQVQTKSAMIGQMNFVSTSIASWISKLPPAPASRLDARKLRQGPLPLSVLRFDDRMFVVQYLWARFTSETPSLLIQGLEKPLFRAYVDEFDHLFSEGVAL
jgi:hypothetical protein